MSFRRWRSALVAPVMAFSAPCLAAAAQSPQGAAAPGAASPADAIQLLQRLYQATKNLTYVGTFVYQHGNVSETSRVARVVDGERVQERIEVLDGSPREIIRAGNEMRAYLPGSLTVKVERGSAPERPMLPILPSQVQELAAVYDIRKGGTSRIAGYDCQSIVLSPRDNMRYGHRFCADIKTGMLVKAQTFDDRNDLVEQFMFTQLRIGPGVVPREDLLSRYRNDSREWRIEESQAAAASGAEGSVVVKGAPAGFRKLAEMRRRFAGNVEVSHIVMSDGLASVSVFVEPASRSKPNPPPLGASRQGAINIYTRLVDDYLVTVVGEAPAVCVEAIARGLETRPNTVVKP